MTIVARQAISFRTHHDVSSATRDGWVVLRTRARQEKAVERFLSAASIHHYLPLVERITTARGRKSVSQVPLFPGYIFLYGQLEHAYAAVETKRVVQVLPVTDQDGFVHEIEQIRAALRQGARLHLAPVMVEGTRCRVRSGPFQGIEGVVSKTLGPSRLALLVHTLGQAALLEVDADLLEPLD